MIVPIAPLAPRNIYEADPGRVVDGDTVHLRDRDVHKIRLLGVNTPELRGGTHESKQLAREATRFVEGWMDEAVDLIVDARGEDNFARELAWLWGRGEVGSWICLNNVILEVWPEYEADARVQWIEAHFARRHGRLPDSVSVMQNEVIVHCSDIGLPEIYPRELLEQAGRAVERQPTA